MTPPQFANERVALYRRVLGEAWDSLPEPLRAMHDLDGERSADGVAVVERGSGLLARLVAFVIGLRRPAPWRPFAPDCTRQDRSQPRQHRRRRRRHLSRTRVVEV